MWFRKRRQKPEHPRPGNTTAVILAHGPDPAGTRGTDHGDPQADAAAPVDGLTPLRGDPLVRWTARSAAASTSRTILVLAEETDIGAWRTALGHTSPVVARARSDDTFRIVHVAEHTRPTRVARTVLEAVEDPFLLLLDPCQPLLAPDVYLSLIERLSGHDAVAYHLDGWWVPLPALWRRSAFDAATREAVADDIGDLSTLLDRVDGRPLGEENLAAVSVDAEAFRPVHDTTAQQAAEAWLSARGVGSDAA